MAKETTYRIVFASGVAPMENLTFEQMTDYKDNNWDDFAAKKFTIEKIEPKSSKGDGQVVRKDDEQAYNEAKNEFIENLSAADRHSVFTQKNKKICHNAKDGFYLRTVKSEAEAYNISLSLLEIQRKRENVADLKNQLMQSFPGKMMHLHRDEVIELINEIFEPIEKRLK